MTLYCITNTITGREYIGTTVRLLSQRWRDHLCSCFSKRIDSPLYAEMRQHGREVFVCEVIEGHDDYSTLLQREREVILERRTLYPHGYNRVMGGRGNYGWVPSSDVRANMSAGQRGRVLSDATKAKLSAFFKGRPNPKNRVSRPAWNKGRTHTEEAKARMRAAKAGKPWSEKRRLAGGTPCTAEQRARVSQAKRAWWASLSREARAAHIQKMRVGA